MIVAYVVLALSVLLLVPLAVWSAVDFWRTGRWVRTVGWSNLLTAMRKGQPRYVSALYAIYRDSLRAKQKTVVETYLDREAERRGLEHLDYRFVTVATPPPEWSDATTAEGPRADEEKTTQK